MNFRGKRLLGLLLPCLTPFAGVRAQAPTGAQRPDLTKEHTLYVVGYAHLDTQWRWEYPLRPAQPLFDTLERDTTQKPGR